jgi:predicted phosphoribosyltransferase
MTPLFENRTDAGRRLGETLAAHSGRPGQIVLALPRGGVPVASEVARALGAPLDLLIVRKLGTPGHTELAMGAVASGGITVLNRDVIAAYGIGEAAIDAAVAEARRELARRERLYRGERPYPALEHRRIVLVDDGIATGATLRAALGALRGRRPASLVVAAPVAPRDTLERLAGLADEIICLASPDPFYAVGQAYRDFSQIRDEEVRDLLARACRETAAEAAVEEMEG